MPKRVPENCPVCNESLESGFTVIVEQEYHADLIDGRANITEESGPILVKGIKCHNCNRTFRGSYSYDE